MPASSDRRPRLRAMVLLALGLAGLTGPGQVRAADVPQPRGPAGDVHRTAAEQVLAFAGLSPAERAALAEGEIVPFSAGVPGTGESLVPADLGVSLAMWVPEPLSRAVAALSGPERPHETGEVVLELSESGDLPDLPLGPQQAEELERLIAFDGGRDANLGPGELASLTSLGVSAPLDTDGIDLLSRAYRDLIEKRMERYLRDGLGGIEPYTRGDGRSRDVGERLEQATRHLVSRLEPLFPRFCRELERYPATRRGRHRYLLVRDTWNDRPQLILVHRIRDINGERALLLHREFFVSQGYDALQVLVVMVPHRGGTLITLTTDVLTDQVTGFGSSVLQFVGRRRVRKTAEARLMKIRAAVMATAPAPVSASKDPVDGDESRESRSGRPAAIRSPAPSPAARAGGGR